MPTTILLMVAVMVVVGATLWMLHEQAAQGDRAVRAIGRLETAVARLDALEWRAIAQGRVSAELESSLRRERDAVDRVFAIAFASQRDERGAGVRRVYGAYVAAVNEELRLLRQGRLAEAQDHDEHVVDPAYSRAATHLAEASRSVRVEVERAGNWALFEAAVTLVAAMLMLALLDSRLQAARRREQLTAEREAALRESNERLTEANSRLETADRLKSEFLSSVSHELRTPLNGIMGFQQLVLDGLCDSHDEELDMLARAQEASGKLNSLINDLLDFSRMEAGRLEFDDVGVEVTPILQSLREEFEHMTRSKGLMLRISPVPGLPLLVRGDASRLHTVLNGLVENAVKFTPTGGVDVRVRVHPSGNHALFEIVDTGIGVSAERRHEIFEAFLQGDGSMTREQGGTGIGLALCRGLVERMGGLIGLESEGEGHGTRAWFTLPLWTDQDHRDAHPDGEIRGPLGAPIVVLVEDDPVSRSWVAEMLRREGFRVAEAVSAEQGWWLMDRHRPDAVVLDYVLRSAPTSSLRSGLDLLNRMQEHTELRDVPVVFVTGFERELRERAAEMGGAAPPLCLSKPVDGAALAVTLRASLGMTQSMRTRVLVAGARPGAFATLQRHLSASQFRLQAAPGGRDCLSVLADGRMAFDVVLLFPCTSMSIAAVVGRIHSDPALTRMPIVAVRSDSGGWGEAEDQAVREGLIAEVVSEAQMAHHPEQLIGTLNALAAALPLPEASPEDEAKAA